MKYSALVRRTMFLVLALLVPAVTVYADDWGGQANARLPHPSMFRPVSTPAQDISTLAVFVVMITTAIFVVVSALLTYSVIRFRARPGDGSEPPQLYGSAPAEFAWTAVPVLIVFVLILTTARSVYTVQAARRPPRSVAARVVGHQWWWEPSVASGRDVFASPACVNCHVVRGVGANGRFGPDLTHLMSRETLVAGAV